MRFTILLILTVLQSGCQPIEGFENYNIMGRIFPSENKTLCNSPHQDKGVEHVSLL